MVLLRKQKEYSKQYPVKWRSVNFSTHRFANVSKFSYKYGHKVFTGPSLELSQLFRIEREKQIMWRILRTLD